jgi:hypothetical protein
MLKILGFAKLKNWQLFLIFLVCLILESNTPFGRFVSAVGFAVWISWIYTIVQVSYPLLPADHSMNKKYFDRSCMILVACVLFVKLFLKDGLRLSLNYYEEQGQGALGYVVFAGSIYLFLNALYLVYFTSKVLLSADEDKMENLFHIILYCIGFCLPPIGVWFIQTRVNYIYTLADEEPVSE